MVERKQPTRPEDIYGLSENEQLFNRISHEHFLSLVTDIETTVHQIQVSANNYGEFLFVTTSRTKEDERHRLTFFGLGYHESRERWISEEWYWYQAYGNSETDKQILSKDTVKKLSKNELMKLPQSLSKAHRHDGDYYLKCWRT